jgi:sarcosine oxidase subunit alpha
MSGRLPAPAGLLIDREHTIEFTFEGRAFTGFAGDTVASALYASGVRALSRSFRYHRLRGPLTMAGNDANTLVRAGADPSALADRVAIAPGLEVRAINTLGGLERDRLAFIDRLAPFLPVGFHYKTFFRPQWTWDHWERLLRRLAGLAGVDLDATNGYYDKQYLFCDVAVIGGGPAGLAAALEAARAGAEVLLVDDNPVLGGALTFARFDAEGKAAETLRTKLVAEVDGQANIRAITDCLCNGWFADNWLPLIEGNRMYKLRARVVVLATGVLEQHAVFRNNDLPGVMLGSAVQRLIRLYGVRPGRRALVLAANDHGHGVALDLLDAGVEVACVADQRAAPGAGPLAAAVHERGVAVFAPTAVREAVPARRGAELMAAIVARGDFDDRFGCDLLAMSGGTAPAGALAAQAGARLRYDEQLNTFRVESERPHLFLAGSLAGTFDLDAAVEDGRIAGYEAAAECGLKARARKPARRRRPGAEGLNPAWPITPHPKGKDFVDFDEDLQVTDIVNAVADGYDHIELVKRYSTVTMGPSQGRHSALPAIRIVARETGVAVAEVGTITARPPVGPEKIAHLAGRSFEPVRHTAMHHRHLEAGAQMMVAGPWLRPAFYGPREARKQAIRDEVLAVREGVGVIDVSTLGGFELRGPDAAEFINRIYTSAHLEQPVGRARYVLMCDRAGVIVDDGVAVRFADDHFYVTATTSGAEGVYRHMLWHNEQWRLKVTVVDVTASWCGVNIAGPRSREVLARLCEGVDLSPAAFPYMGAREGTVAGIPARLLRVGFVGELGYEIHAPAHAGEALWDALIEAGAGERIRRFGIEAQRQLRLEKGHIIVGQDTDALTHPAEAGMAWAIARNKPTFVGKRSIAIHEANGLTRKLVGFEIAEGATPAPEECHLVVRGPGRDDAITGRVTSVGHSPTLGKVIGLATVAPDQAGPGGTITIKVAGELVEATVVKPPFYDPDNERQEL